jgi:DNA-binding NarL/FixJ family response regulator
MNHPVTLIIADDHPLFRRGVVEVLAADTEIKLLAEAGDGAAALQAILDHRPAVALLDVHMPKLAGLQVAAELQQRGLTTRVIFLTMYEDQQTFNAAMDLGALGFILKDSAAEDVVECVKAVAAGKHFISPTISGLLVKRTQGARELRAVRPGLESLTPAERRILKLVASDRTSKEIADELGLSPRTVETHRLNICQKLEIHGVHALVKFAFENKARL